jgi:hypothetical protein
MAVGPEPGGWHCADGSLCESAAALTCCCGCPETGGQIVHECEEQGPQLRPAEECGCYYHAEGAEALAKARRVELAAAAAVASEPLTFVPPAVTILWQALPPACHGPPGCVLSPGINRGPPSA